MCGIASVRSVLCCCVSLRYDLRQFGVEVCLSPICSIAVSRFFSFQASSCAPVYHSLPLSAEEPILPGLNLEACRLFALPAAEIVEWWECDALNVLLTLFAQPVLRKETALER